MDLTKEEILTLFKKVAIPASVGTFFQTMYNIVDTYFAGKISPESLSALAKSFPLYFLIIATGIGLSVASTAMMANNIGEGNKNKASYFLAQAITFAIFIAIIITFVGLNISVPLLKLMGSSDENIMLTLNYLDIIFIGSIVIYIQFAVNSSLTAQGDTNTETIAPASMARPFATGAPLSEDTAGMPESVAKAVTRDYSGLMKAINKKKGI